MTGQERYFSYVAGDDYVVRGEELTRVLGNPSLGGLNMVNKWGTCALPVSRDIWG